jgi:hypothetical protein
VVLLSYGQVAGSAPGAHVTGELATGTVTAIGAMVVATGQSAGGGAAVAAVVIAGSGGTGAAATAIVVVVHSGAGTVVTAEAAAVLPGWGRKPRMWKPPIDTAATSPVETTSAPDAAAAMAFRRSNSSHLPGIRSDYGFVTTGAELKSNPPFSIKTLPAHNLRIGRIGYRRGVPPNVKIHVATYDRRS